MRGLISHGAHQFNNASRSGIIFQGSARSCILRCEPRRVRGIRFVVLFVQFELVSIFVSPLIEELIYRATYILWLQVTVLTYPGVEEAVTVIKRDKEGRYLLPSGVVPPAAFAKNEENGAWHCLDSIVKHFQNRPRVLGDRDDLKALDRQALKDWLLFGQEFPDNGKLNDGHWRWVEKHRNDPKMYNVPFAEFFANGDRGEYDRQVVDQLLGGYTYDQASLPRGMTMPSAHIGVKRITKGGNKDVDPRQFCNGDKFVRSKKRTHEELVEKKEKKVKGASKKQRLNDKPQQEAKAAEGTRSVKVAGDTTAREESDMKRRARQSTMKFFDKTRGRLVASR
jgi:hypothetical protein